MIIKRFQKSSYFDEHNKEIIGTHFRRKTRSNVKKMELTSKERMLAALNLEEPDLVPVAPYVGRHYIPKVMGLQISDWVLE